MAKGQKTGGGSRKGIPNKLTATVKDMIIQSLNELGGVEYLVQQARQSPAAYLSLLGRAMPLQVSGDPENPLQAELVVRYRLPDNGR